MVQLARTNLGWTSDLGGTGMCLTAAAIAAVGGFGTSLVEDQETFHPWGIETCAFS
jgi:hypothetical protein